MTTLQEEADKIISMANRLPVGRDVSYACYPDRDHEGLAKLVVATDPNLEHVDTTDQPHHTGRVFKLMRFRRKA